MVRLLDRGVIVDLEDGLEGFIPLSQLGVDSLKKRRQLQAGRSARPQGDARRPQAHRIILSAKAWVADQDRAGQEAFQERFKPAPSASDETAEIPAVEAGDEAPTA